MAKISVFSRLRNDVEFRLYKTENVKTELGIKLTNSQAVRKVVIKGVTNYLRENDKRISLLNQIAKTEIDGDLWDAIVKENGEGNVLLRKGQIFTAKSELEAKSQMKDIPSFISDLMTPEQLKKKKPEQRKLI